jgi:hypothetical protein
MPVASGMQVPAKKKRLVDLGGFGWRDADEASTAAAVFELDVPGNEREQSIIFALADIFARLVLGAALANQNRARIDQLPSEALYAEALAVRIAAVCRGAATFFVCHDAIPFRDSNFVKAILFRIGLNCTRAASRRKRSTGRSACAAYSLMSLTCTAV